MDVIAVVKKYPIPIGVGALVIILLVASRGSSSASPSSNSAALAGAMAANGAAQAQISGINAQMAVATGAQATERYKAGEESAMARMGIAASMFSVASQMSAAVSADNNKTSVSNMMGILNSQSVRAQTESEQAVAEKTIAANINNTRATLDAQMYMNANNNNTKLSALGIETQGNLAALDIAGKTQLAALNASVAGQTSLATIAAGLQKDLFGMNIASNEKTLPAILQNAENMARIEGKTAVDITYWNQKAGIKTAQAAKNASDWGIVTNLGKMLGGFF